MKRYRNMALIILVVSLLVATGCANLVKNSAATLSASQNFYEIALRSCAELYHGGIINDDQKDDIIKAATIYQNAHNVAVDALVAYNAAATAENKDRLKVAVEYAIAAWADVAKLINSIKPGLVPDEIADGEGLLHERYFRVASVYQGGA